MLEVKIKGGEFFDSKSNMFIEIKDTVLHLEHSLISLSKWEEKWKKPFLSKENKTIEETIDYIRCMTINHDVNPMVYLLIDNDVIKKVQEYIEDPMTATTIKEEKSYSREIITAEIIYYWMIALQIPPEYAKWHLNKLLTLIRVCNIKNSPPKKMNKKDLINRNRNLNAARRAAANSKG